MIARRCRTWDTTNTTADIYLLVENGHENNETKRSLFKLIKKFTRTIDCRLSSWKTLNTFHTLSITFLNGKCWLGKTSLTFCQIKYSDVNIDVSNYTSV